MTLNRLASIGLQNFTMDYSIVALHNQILMHDGTENFILQDEGSIDKYLGVSISQLDDKSFELFFYPNSVLNFFFL